MEAISELVQRFVVPLQGASANTEKLLVNSSYYRIMPLNSFQFLPLIIWLCSGGYFMHPLLVNGLMY